MLTFFLKKEDNITKKLYEEAHKCFINAITKVTMEYEKPKDGAPVIEYGKEFNQIAKGVKGIKCSLDAYSNDTTIANVVMEPRGEIGLHKHSKHEEWIFVLEGEITDNETNTHYTTGMVHYIPAGQKHHIVSNTGALLVVTWQPKFITE
jgi:quercetin dioxygenase-like cupin family protein